MRMEFCSLTDRQPAVVEDPLGLVERACLVEVGLSTLRHDIRNKLAAVRQAAFYLKTKTSSTELWDANPRVQKFFALIDSELETAGGMLSDDTHTSGVRPRRADAVELAATAARAIELSRGGAGVGIDTDLGEGSCVGDADEIALAIRCLVENALQASHEGQRVRVLGHVSENRYALHVIDQGPGIPVELRTHLVRPFQTTREGRSGVGLAIASRIAQRHGGELRFEDRQEGFTATLTLGEKPED